jgi:hypothetical protein
MALSNLTLLSQGNAPNIAVTPYGIPPTVAPGSGNMDNEVGFNVLGYTTGNTNVLVFRVVDWFNTSSALALSRDNLSITVTDTRTAVPDITTSFYSVDMGMDTVNGADWRLTFNVILRDSTQQSYIFVKGKASKKGG